MAKTKQTSRWMVLQAKQKAKPRGLGIFSFFVLGINKFEQKSMPGSVQMALEKSPF